MNKKENQNLEVVLAEPRGFCAGVERAIEIVERALERFGAPVYVRHEIVHNTHVVSSLREKGAIFVDEIKDVPLGSRVIMSAHGVSIKVQNQAQKRKFNVFDATCPLVTKVHSEVKKLSKQGFEIIMIGHNGHPEVEGTMGQLNKKIYLVEDARQADLVEVDSPERLSYVTQTTLSTDDTAEIIKILKKRFPNIVGPKVSDICYATQNRQDAVKMLAKQVDLVLVVGSPTSSNSNRLREVAEKYGAKAYLIDGAKDLNPDWLKNSESVGVTAGASAPESLVESLLEEIKLHGASSVRRLPGAQEHVRFPLPKSLTQ
ncbi:MAG: 4-hydroxy-3-methylbut-2-enyl diphosphate reductase [Betaproteobacteria bacterium TMED156]|nr:MAG: 4-hydroxy-3-methylbut-2-enyl diphosphate reductase [Betaproteobacteria bacterium TMED156]